MDKNEKHFRLRIFLTGLLMMLCATVSAQDIKVTGVVKDTSGEPAIGATIRVKGY